MKIATFNINNINKRLHNLAAWLARAQPDVSRGPNLRAPLGGIRDDASQPAGGGTLEQVGGVVSKAAARLGMPRTTLNALMRKLGISRKDL